MTSKSIFFDLETTDLSPVGQIINCCFSVADSNFRVHHKLERRVKVSRLQLPRIGALLKNQTIIEKHQEEADNVEAEVMREVYQFFVSHTQNEKVPLIGFNSAKFDVEYLRTSLIRNGFNPYFNVYYKDLLHVCRYLACFSEVFREKLAIDDGGKLSLKLENLAKKAGLLEGSQAHESSQDVELTIRLAEFIKKNYGLDARTFNAYEGLKFHGKVGSIVKRIQPNYESPREPTISHSSLLDSDHRYALWIDLESYIRIKEKDGDLRSCIQFLKVEGGDFFLLKDEVPDSKWHEISKTALRDLKEYNLKNFFGKTTCDIEAFIYRIPFDEINALYKIIWEGSNQKLKLDDAKRVLGRYRLANLASDDDYVLKNLPTYSEYRYGGSMLISRFETEDEGKRIYHPTLRSLFLELEEAKKAASSKEEREIISSLERFYLSSEIYRCSGDKLLANQDKAA